MMAAQANAHPGPFAKAEEKLAALADPVEEYPDPDEDDLDDLDDMLDEFSLKKSDPKKAAGPGRPAAEAAAAPVPEPSVEDVLNDEEFAKQLQAGMADLLGELEKSPEMQAQFEDMFKQLGAVAAGADDAEPAAAAAAAAEPSRSAEDEGSFQDKIRRTMERMQESGDQATAAATAEGSDDLMAEMLKQLGAGGLDGAGSDEEFSKMLAGMMEQLTAKEILYEPMKELDDKFPEWMAKNKDVVPRDDLKRYEEQQGIVRQIVAKFEEKTFSDSNPADREHIVELMQKMQAAGSPPSDLIGDMSSAQDALGAPEEGCNPQ